MREKYHIKENKKAFLYPQEYRKFFETLSDKQQSYFKIAINTGGRINEIQHLTPGDISDERPIITFRITKVRAKKGETRPEPRDVVVSSEFKSWLLRYIKINKIKSDESIVKHSTVAIQKIIKKKLFEVGVKNPNDFSSHNFRKTHGNWLRAIGVIDSEICLRLGHDMNTMLGHYVSPNLFTTADKVLIVDELGDLYKDARKI